MRYVSITLIYETQTEKALGFCDPEAGVVLLEPVWIPKSEIRNFEDLPDFTEYENRELDLEIPAWLAVKKGLDPFVEELEDETR